MEFLLLLAGLLCCHSATGTVLTVNQAAFEHGLVSSSFMTMPLTYNLGDSILSHGDVVDFGAFSLRMNAGNSLVVANVREPVVDKHRVSFTSVGMRPALYVVLFLVVQAMLIYSLIGHEISKVSKEFKGQHERFHQTSTTTPPPTTTTTTTTTAPTTTTPPPATSAAISFPVVDLSLLGVPPPRYECRDTATAPSFKLCHYNPEEDIWVSAMIRNQGVWEPNKMAEMGAIFKQLIASGVDVVFADVGSNLGLFALQAASLGVKHIYAFEPLPPNFGLIAASVLANPPQFRSSIQIIAAGAGAKDEVLQIYVDLKNRGGTSFNSEKLSLEGVTNRGVDYKCRILPIDSVIKQRVHVMKIDVESFESCVIAGGRELFHKHGVAVIFLEVWSRLSPCASSANAMLDELFDLGYRFYKHPPANLRTSPPDLSSKEALAQWLSSFPLNEDILLVRPDLL